MAGRAKSAEKKARIKRAKDDGAMQRAVAEYLAGQTAHPGRSSKGKGLRAIAKKHNVAWRTLGDLAKGGKSLSSFNAEKRKLTPAEEAILLRFTLANADRGFGFDIPGLTDVASALVAARDPSLLPLGHNLIDRFISRNDALKGHWARALAKVRANAGNPEVIRHFYVEIVYKNIYDRPGGLAAIPPELLYAGDESAVSKGFHSRARIIGSAEAKMVYQQGVEDRELITVLPTVCGDGTYIPPLFIFAGEHLQAEWQRNNVLGGAFAVSPNGWTDNELALWWLEHIFDKHTREKAAGRTRVLFLDGHGSHLSLPFLQYSIEHNIMVLCYPPHTTHLLQGLDVVAFAVLKREYAKEVKAFEEENGSRGLRKRDFAGVFGRAFLRAFKPETVKATFSVTGIYPYNPDAVDLRKLKPSEAASIHGAFPLEQPSPVRRVMASQATVAPVPRPSTPPTAGSSFPLDPALIPSTPVRPRLPDYSMFTPRTRWCTLEASLGASVTASALVSNAPITAAQVEVINSSPVLERVPAFGQPDWTLIDNPRATAMQLREALRAAQRRDLAQQGILEGSHATMVIQNMTIKKLNISLYGKEDMEKDKTRTLFPKGFGRVATDAQMIAQLEKQNTEKRAKESAKNARKEKREARKEAKAAADREWERMKQAHQASMELYTQEVAGLKREGVPQRSWPAKPKLGRKPKPVEPEDDEEESSESGGDPMDI